jgi:hypothetical protein
MWTPEWRTSLYGGYTAVEYNNTAKAQFAENVCAAVSMTSGGVITGGGQGQFNAGVGNNASTLTQLTNQTRSGGKTLSVASKCDPDWGFVQLGTRTQWSPSAGLTLGVDVSYMHIFTAFKDQQANLQGAAFGASSGNANVIQPVVGARPNGVYNLKDLGIFSVVFRAQRNFNSGD